MCLQRLFWSLGLAVGLATTPVEADWLRFRGPNGTGISPDSAAVPTDWSPTKHVKWKTPLPGAGVSSPIVVGQRVFVTCYSGYGLDRQDPGDINDLKRHLVCVDAESGEIQWERTIDAVQPEDPYTGIGVTAHGYASHTPVSDGQKVYAFFGKSGVIAFDLDGNEQWRASVGSGSDPQRWGSSSSPILFANLVIVTASAESRSLVGLNKETGEEVWRQEADGLSNVWGTPALVELDETRTDLVLGVPFEFWGLNPETGKLRWFAETMDTDQYSSSLAVSGGIVYGIEGRSGGSAAVKVGGSGDITSSHTLWSGRDASRFGSPLVLDGRIYFFSNGLANCLNADDGSVVFKERLPNPQRPEGMDDPQRSGADQASDSRREGGREGFGGGRFGGGFGGRGGRGGGFGAIDYASPVAADGKIYYLKSDGTTYVLRASDAFELLATNSVSDARESFGGTPAISAGRLFLRSDKHLYCIGE